MDDVFNRFPRLKEREKQVAGTLSGGEQQMLAMGRALMSKPKLLMLDEPSMGLAPILVEQIFDIIKELHAAGTTILLVEQNAQMALSDRRSRVRAGHRTHHDVRFCARTCWRTIACARRIWAAKSICPCRECGKGCFRRKENKYATAEAGSVSGIQISFEYPLFAGR